MRIYAIFFVQLVILACSYGTGVVIFVTQGFRHGFQCHRKHLVYPLYSANIEVLLDIVWNLFQVSFVFLRNNNRFYSTTACRQQLFFQSADR